MKTGKRKGKVRLVEREFLSDKSAHDAVVKPNDADKGGSVTLQTFTCPQRKYMRALP